MRVIPITVANSTASGSSSLAWGILIVRTDGMSLSFASTDRPKFIDSAVGLAQPGFQVQSVDFSAGLAVDNTEITIVPDDLSVTREDIIAGYWDGAAFELFQFNWKDPTGGRAARMTGRLGNLSPKGLAYVAEMRDIRQTLQQDNTAVMQETCRYRLGSTAPPDGWCMVDLAPFTEALSVTAVSSNSEFTDSARVEAAEYFSYGWIDWLTGDNAGLRSTVRSFAAGVFELAQPLVYAIQVGDTGDAVAGCDKARSTCRDKFDNVLNFGGEPDKPAVDSITAPAVFP